MPLLSPQCYADNGVNPIILLLKLYVFHKFSSSLESSTLISIMFQHFSKSSKLRVNWRSGKVRRRRKLLEKMFVWQKRDAAVWRTFSPAHDGIHCFIIKICQIKRGKKSQSKHFIGSQNMRASSKFEKKLWRLIRAQE